MIIAGIKWLTPKIPPVVLPLIAPVIGIILDQLTALVSSHQSNLFIAILSGGAGVWLREMVDQTKKVGASRTAARTVLFIILPLLFATGCSSITPAKVQQGATTLTRAASGHAEYLPYLTAARDAICIVAGSTNVTPAAVSGGIQGIGGNQPSAAIAITDGILALLNLAYISFDVPPAGGTFGPYVLAACNGMTAGLPAAAKASAIAPDWHLIKIP
jgi:hypothetical protein